MPSSTSAGVFGMTRTTATPSGTRDSMKAVVIPAARETSSWPGRRESEISASRSPMSWGLTTTATVSASLVASRLETTRDAVPLLELAGPLGTLLADEQVVDPAAGPDQPGQQGLAHHAGTEDRGLGHCGTYFFETSDFRKNVRFCGRSARRLMR